MMLLTPTPKLLNATRNLTLGKLRGHLGKLNVSYIINSYQFGIDSQKYMSNYQLSLRISCPNMTMILIFYVEAASCLNSRMSSRYILRDRKVSTWLPDTTRYLFWAWILLRRHCLPCPCYVCCGSTGYVGMDRLIRVWCISDKGNPLGSNLIKYFSSSRSVVYTRDWIIKKEILVC